MTYVDGYVLPVAKKKVAAYKKLAQMAAKAWMRHGALSYRECVSDDLKTKCGTPFDKMSKAKPSEVVIFAWIEFKSRKERDRINKAVMKEFEASGMDPADMPVDAKRMAWAGFTTLVKG
jgi:uncharacterized protein YbaA (DUF1428 family)